MRKAMKKIIFLFGSLLLFVFSCIGQYEPPNNHYGVFGQYPYFHYYNWPQTGIAHEGTDRCTAEITRFIGGIDEYEYWEERHQNGELWHLNEYAVLQRATDTLRVVGISAGSMQGMGDSIKVTIYDTMMSEIASVAEALWPPLEYFVFDEPDYCSDSSHHFRSNTGMGFHFFDEPINLAGDYYLAVRATILTPWFRFECHDEPYNFPGNTYRVRIDGVWETHTSRRSIPLIFLLIDPPCDCVDSISVDAETEGCVTLGWEKQSIRSLWKVSYGPVGMPQVRKREVLVDSNMVTICGLSPDTAYCFSVSSRCDYLQERHTWSEWSMAVVVNPDGEVFGIEGVEAPEVTLAPNPTDGRLMVRCGAEITAMELYDMQGRAVLTAKGSGTEAVLDLTALPNGTYTAVVNTPQGRVARTVEKH